MAAFMKMYPHLEASDVLCFRISRQRYVYPLPILGYSTRVTPHRSSIPNLHFVNSGQIVNGTLNVNQTLRLAEEALPGLLEDVS